MAISSDTREAFDESGLNPRGASPLKKPLHARLASCVVERRVPWICVRLGRKLDVELYRLKCLWEHWRPDPAGGHLAASYARNPRCLYASAVGREGKPLLESIIESVDVPDMDFLVFCYDDTSFDEDVFRDIRLIRTKGLKWQLMKKYLTPDLCRNYDYIFAWDDDIAVDGFSFRRFMEIMRRNRLEAAQPALTPDSYVSIGLTRRHAGVAGRFTDAIENMVPVFTRPAWEKYWVSLEEHGSFWGWQHVDTARSACGYRRMGIIDRECVRHTRPVRSKRTTAREEQQSYFDRHPELTRARRIVYGHMK
ncbi:MAG: DUF707 domain-containing protein [Arenicellales bacterium]